MSSKNPRAPRIQPEERRLLILLSAIFLSFKIGLEIAGNLAEVLYFHRVGVENLPKLYAVEPLAMVLVLLVFSPVLDRLNRRTLLFLLILIFAFSLIAARVLILAGWQPFYFVQYINQRIFFILTQLVFWLLCSDLFDIRQAKRLFPLIMAIGLVGVLLGNLLTGILSGFLSPEQILPLTSLFFVFSAGMMFWLARQQFPASFVKPKVETDKRFSPALPFDLLKQPFIQALVVLILITGALEPIWRYELNFIADTAIAGEHNLIAFYGYFKGLAVLVTILFQIFITGRLMQKMGVLWSLSSHPLGLIGIMLLLGSFPNLPVAILSVALIGIIRVGFDESGRKTIISIYPPHERGRLSTFERQVSYLGIFLGSLLMIWAVERLNLSQINWIAAGIAGLWLLVLPGLRQKYARVCLQRGELPLDLAAPPAPQDATEEGEQLLQWIDQLPGNGDERLTAVVQAAGLRDRRIDQFISEQLARSADQAVISQLHQALRSPIWSVRQFARGAILDKAPADDLMRSQITHFEKVTALYPVKETSKLVRENQRATAEAILLLLEGGASPSKIPVVARMLRSLAPDLRANGLEALENLLKTPHKAQLMALFEAVFAPPDERQAIESQSPTENDRSLVLEQMAQFPDPEIAFWGQVVRIRAGEIGYQPPRFSVSADRTGSPTILASVLFPSNGEKAMELAYKIDAVRNTEVFGNLTESELHAIALCAREVHHPADEVIFEEGEQGSSLYIILDGQVELACVAEKKSLQALGAGQVFGEHALLTNEPYALTAVTISEVDLLVLEREVLLELVNYYPNIALDLLQNMAKRFEKTTALLQRVWV